MHPLLIKVLEKPGIYLGFPSITRLRAFLDGYEYAIYEEDSKQSRIILEGFNEYVAKRYEIRSSHDWSSMILFMTTTEEKAFWEFYKLYQQYEEQQSLIVAFRENFVIDSKNEGKKLVWNSLKDEISEQVSLITLDEGIQLLKNLNEKDFIFYDERNFYCEEVDCSRAIVKIDDVKYSEDADLYFFDKEYKWFMIFTHEDLVLKYHC